MTATGISQEGETWMADPRVERVVMITHNRREELSHSLTRLGGLPEQPKVTVVDNGSQDGSPDLVREEFSKVRL
jgi:GT2 family glycosyltransferase